MRRPKGFQRFLTLARGYLQDPHSRSRFLAAVKEYATRKEGLIRGFRGDLQILAGLVRDWSSGEYAGVSKKTLLFAIAALLYFLSPLDTVPDFLGAVGFADDAAIVLFVLNSLKKEIDRYREWRAKR